LKRYCFSAAHRITVFATVRKAAKQSNARVVKTARWAPDEWAVVQQKARLARLSESEYIRCKVLNLLLAPRARKSTS
jgi:hypothetical protein